MKEIKTVDCTESVLMRKERRNSPVWRGILPVGKLILCCHEQYLLTVNGIFCFHKRHFNIRRKKEEESIFFWWGRLAGKSSFSSINRLQQHGTAFLFVAASTIIRWKAMKGMGEAVRQGDFCASSFSCLLLLYSFYRLLYLRLMSVSGASGEVVLNVDYAHRVDQAVKIKERDRCC